MRTHTITAVQTQHIYRIPPRTRLVQRRFQVPTLFIPPPAVSTIDPIIISSVILRKHNLQRR